MTVGGAADNTEIRGASQVPSLTATVETFEADGRTSL
jgi:hypothetical protein